ncbi:hypothetical protein BSL78_10430 [Apostichopus japonicus]|uniref:Uncharacterized protein n=1 Tax=Stichopus japonicus TaxID=307972 RepID=A0A2G8KXC0_STIJA|nr:hypothetical protein BSL78_10430 [Apostichopus japonicus]
MTTFNGLSNRTEPRHKPPSGGTKSRRSKPPEGRNSSTPSSVSNNQGENNFGLTTNRLTMSNSAPSTSSRASTSSRSPGKINPDRGRRERRNELPGARRRARSTSTGRKTPSDRLHPSQPEKLEMIENLFLGSPHGKLISEGSQGQRARQGQLARRQHRASSLPGKTEEVAMLDITLSGYKVDRE